MGTVMETKLVKAFESFDFSGHGALQKDDVMEICKQLNPNMWTADKVDTLFKNLDKGRTGYVDYSEFAIWVTGGMQDNKWAIDGTPAAMMHGERLAEGDRTDAGRDQIRSYLNNALDLKPSEYATPKATTKLTWLREVGNLLDPAQNPGGFRICQHALVERGAIGPLLGLANHALSDAVVIKSLELLARAAFNNIEAAVEVASDGSFLPTLHTVLTQRELPEKLTALQLAQAIAASSTAPKVKEMLPQLLAEVAPKLSQNTFLVLPRAAFDVFVSTSFSNPAVVVDTLSWAGVASLLAEDRDAGRPEWLDHDPLTVLTCGLLAANVLALPSPASICVDEFHLRQVVKHRLCASNFLELFVLAMEAAVTQREWPATSGAFHSVSRLSSMALVLAGLGFRRELRGAVELLAKAVEIDPDGSTSCVALLALRSLVADFVCLETFLTLTEFRSETLEVLHKAGDEREASDLLSYSTAAEDALAVAQAALEQSELSSPPTVRFLAELFNEQVPMDGELSKNQLLQILPSVPIGPAKDVEASLSGDKFPFAVFAQQVYGTPTLLGWWPSLMEETNSMWSTPAFQNLHPPPLADLLFYYEQGAKGVSGVSSDVILDEILPAWKQPVEGEQVEELFAEIRGEHLDFKEFGSWMCRYFHAVDQLRKEGESAAQ